MKICVLGFEGGAPQVVFRDERLGNLRRLMDAGVYGLLESVVPPESLPAWMSLGSSRDPGSLGVYGNRNRANHGYEAPALIQPGTFESQAIWDHLAKKGRNSILVGVPPDGRLRRVGAGPSDLKELAGEYPVDVVPDRSDQKDRFKEEVFRVGAKQWQVAQRLLVEEKWDYFQFVDMGLDRLQHRFWEHFDEKHLRFDPDNPYRSVIADYYRWLDEQVGSVFEVIDNETIVLVLSAYGAQRLHGVFALNQWLIREGLLVLHEYPSTPTAFEKLNVDWRRTKVWSEGGYCARVFFNVQGREPQGSIPPEQYESLASELKVRLESLTDDSGHSLQTLVFKPREIYREVRNIAPDLMVSLGGLFWRSTDSVGHSRLCLEQDGSDGCNHAEYGFFILAAPNCPLQGEYEGARLLDMAPTLLDLAGCEIPGAMQGKSLVAGMEKKKSDGGTDADDAAKLIHDRLAGLGYI
jgi:predicted AlkP superfamily phosphohydrolase/phosphomutase